jgi:hypothetical protein
MQERKKGRGKEKEGRAAEEEICCEEKNYQLNSLVNKMNRTSNK